MKKIIPTFFVMMCTQLAVSQIPIDTSYTVSSTYKKEIRKYPFIKIADRPLDTSINVQNDIVYKQITSRELHLDAYFNAGKSSLAAIILIHGGGWKSGNKSQMRSLAQELATKGFACFAVEYRLSGEAKYPAAIVDVKSAIEFIRENAGKFNIDKNKIAVLGCSSGGQMASLIGATSTVQAIINMDGILAFDHPESQESQVAALWLGGDKLQNSKAWSEASALTHCNKEMPPILFINSDKPRFHAGRDDMIAMLNQFGIYNQVKLIDNSPHSFWFFEPWFDEIVNYSAQFLDTIFKQK